MRAEPFSCDLCHTAHSDQTPMKVLNYDFKVIRCVWDAPTRSPFRKQRVSNVLFGIFAMSAAMACVDRRGRTAHVSHRLVGHSLAALQELAALPREQLRVRQRPRRGLAAEPCRAEGRQLLAPRRLIAAAQQADGS